MRPPTKQIPIPELITLLALMVSIVALSIDAMLPALDTIGSDLGVTNKNDNQYVITSLFLGFAVGQLLTGPLSDSIGRKPVIYIGYVVFIIGCLLSIFATEYSTMLVGRVMQGLGAACPRIVSLAMTRDLFEGRRMARIMSFVMAVFILVPMVAPTIGLVVMTYFGWRSIFTLLMIMVIVTSIWFALRPPETLAPENRRPFSLKSIIDGTREAFSYRKAVGYTLASGLVFGAFIGYLSSSQQIFQTTFQVGDLFAVYFAAAALSIGLASVLNAKLVLQFGMRLLTFRALIIATSLSLLFLIPSYLNNGIPPLWLFMLWNAPTFFCMGIMFGNLNALAMEPLGHMAGIGAALTGFFSTMLALPLAWVVGYFFDGTVYSLVTGFALLGACAIGVMLWTESEGIQETG